VSALSHQIEHLVEDALARIDDDAPDYVEPLHALRELPGALFALESRPELASRLFVELRKLRPFPLWVRDTPARALALKQLAKLDGAICVGGAMPAPEGRECWSEVAAGLAEEALRALPSGWGLIVRGEVARVPWAALRKLSPLRALGAALDGDPMPRGPYLVPALSDTRLDLVTLDPSRAGETHTGSRVLWVLDGDAGPRGARSVTLRELAEQALELTEMARFSGVLCAGQQALSCALGFASVRAGRPAR
jgi:hypothetical protein